MGMPNKGTIASPRLDLPQMGWDLVGSAADGVGSGGICRRGGGIWRDLPQTGWDLAGSAADGVGSGGILPLTCRSLREKVAYCPMLQPPRDHQMD